MFHIVVYVRIFYQISSWPVGGAHTETLLDVLTPPQMKEKSRLWQSASRMCGRAASDASQLILVVGGAIMSRFRIIPVKCRRNGHVSGTMQTAASESGGPSATFCVRSIWRFTDVPKPHSERFQDARIKNDPSPQSCSVSTCVFKNTFSPPSLHARQRGAPSWTTQAWRLPPPSSYSWTQKKTKTSRTTYHRRAGYKCWCCIFFLSLFVLPLGNVRMLR